MNFEGLPFSIKKGSWEVGLAFGLPLTGDGKAFASLPSLLLLKRGGKPLLWVEGEDMDIRSLLARASQALSK